MTSLNILDTKQCVGPIDRYQIDFTYVSKPWISPNPMNYLLIEPLNIININAITNPIEYCWKLSIWNGSESRLSSDLIIPLKGNDIEKNVFVLELPEEMLLNNNKKNTNVIHIIIELIHRNSGYPISHAIAHILPITNTINDGGDSDNIRPTILSSFYSTAPPPPPPPPPPIDSSPKRSNAKSGLAALAAERKKNQFIAELDLKSVKNAVTTISLGCCYNLSIPMITVPIISNSNLNDFPIVPTFSSVISILTTHSKVSNWKFKEANLNNSYLLSTKNSPMKSPMKSSMNISSMKSPLKSPMNKKNSNIYSLLIFPSVNPSAHATICNLSNKNFNIDAKESINPIRVYMTVTDLQLTNDILQLHIKEKIIVSGQCVSFPERSTRRGRSKPETINNKIENDMNKSKIIANQGLSQCLSYLGSISNMHGDWIHNSEIQYPKTNSFIQSIQPSIDNIAISVSILLPDLDHNGVLKHVICIGLLNSSCYIKSVNDGDDNHDGLISGDYLVPLTTEGIKPIYQNGNGEFTSQNIIVGNVTVKLNIYGDNNYIEHASEQNKRDCVNLYIALNSDPNVEYPEWLYVDEDREDENSENHEELRQTINKVNVNYKLLSINDTLNSLLNCCRKMKIIQLQSSNINSIEIENDERILLHVVGNLINNLYNIMKDSNVNQFIQLIRQRDLDNNNNGIIWMINVWLYNWLSSEHRADIVSRASKHDFVDDINYNSDPNLIPLNNTETMILSTACVSLMILYFNKIIECDNNNNNNNSNSNQNNISINGPNNYNLELRDISSLSEDLLHTIIDFSKQCIDKFISECKLESSNKHNNNTLQSSINTSTNIELESIIKLNQMNNNYIELFLCLVNSMGELSLNVSSSIASYISSIIKASMLLINSTTSAMILSIYSSILSFIDVVINNQPEGLEHLYINSPSLWSISNFGKYPVHKHDESEPCSITMLITASITVICENIYSTNLLRHQTDKYGKSWQLISNTLTSLTNTIDKLLIKPLLYPNNINGMNSLIWFGERCNFIETILTCCQTNLSLLDKNSNHQSYISMNIIDNTRLMFDAIITSLINNNNKNNFSNSFNADVANDIINRSYDVHEIVDFFLLLAEEEKFSQENHCAILLLTCINTFFEIDWQNITNTCITPTLSVAAYDKHKQNDVNFIVFSNMCTINKYSLINMQQQFIKDINIIQVSASLLLTRARLDPLLSFENISLFKSTFDEDINLTSCWSGFDIKSLDDAHEEGPIAHWIRLWKQIVNSTSTLIKKGLSMGIFNNTLDKNEEIFFGLDVDGYPELIVDDGNPSVLLQIVSLLTDISLLRPLLPQNEKELQPRPDIVLLCLENNYNSTKILTTLLTTATYCIDRIEIHDVAQARGLLVSECLRMLNIIPSVNLNTDLFTLISHMVLFTVPDKILIDIPIIYNILGLGKEIEEENLLNNNIFIYSKGCKYVINEFYSAIYNNQLNNQGDNHDMFFQLNRRLTALRTYISSKVNIIELEKLPDSSNNKLYSRYSQLVAAGALQCFLPSKSHYLIDKSNNEITYHLLTRITFLLEELISLGAIERDVKHWVDVRLINKNTLAIESQANYDVDPMDILGHAHIASLSLLRLFLFINENSNQMTPLPSIEKVHQLIKTTIRELTLAGEWDIARSITAYAIEKCNFNISFINHSSSIPTSINSSLNSSFSRINITKNNNNKTNSINNNYFSQLMIRNKSMISELSKNDNTLEERMQNDGKYRPLPIFYAIRFSISPFENKDIINNNNLNDFFESTSCSPIAHCNEVINFININEENNDKTNVEFANKSIWLLLRCDPLSFVGGASLYSDYASLENSKITQPPLFNPPTSYQAMKNELCKSFPSFQFLDSQIYGKKSYNLPDNYQSMQLFHAYPSFVCDEYAYNLKVQCHRYAEDDDSSRDNSSLFEGTRDSTTLNSTHDSSTCDETETDSDDEEEKKNEFDVEEEIDEEKEETLWQQFMHSENFYIYSFEDDYADLYNTIDNGVNRFSLSIERCKNELVGLDLVSDIHTGNKGDVEGNIYDAVAAIHWLAGSCLGVVNEYINMPTIESCLIVNNMERLYIKRVTTALKYLNSLSISELNTQPLGDIVSKSSVIVATITVLANCLCKPHGKAIGYYNMKTIIAAEVERRDTIWQDLRKEAKQNYFRNQSAYEEKYKARLAILEKLEEEELELDEEDSDDESKVVQPVNSSFFKLTGSRSPTITNEQENKKEIKLRKEKIRYRIDKVLNSIPPPPREPNLDIIEKKLKRDPTFFPSIDNLKHTNNHMNFMVDKSLSVLRSCIYSKINDIPDDYDYEEIIMAQLLLWLESSFASIDVGQL